MPMGGFKIGNGVGKRCQDDGAGPTCSNRKRGREGNQLVSTRRIRLVGVDGGIDITSFVEFFFYPV